MSLTRAEHEIKKALVIGLFLAIEDRPTASRTGRKDRPGGTRTTRTGLPGTSRPARRTWPQ